MRPRMTWNLFRRMIGCLLLYGMRGVVVGMCAGAAAGMVVGMYFFAAAGLIFCILGTLAGAVVAVPCGFFAGVVGLTVGKRWGWGIGGALVIVLLYYAYLWFDPRLDPISSVALGVGCMYGFGIGLWYGGTVPDPYLDLRVVRTPLKHVDYVTLYRDSPDFVALYDIAPGWRILAAVATLVLAAGTVWDVYRIVAALAA